MADQFRFRYGQQQLQKYAVASATVIDIGDLVVYDAANDQVIPAEDFTGSTDLATTQANAAEVFVGVAAEKSAAGDTEDISVDVSPDAVYEFDAASATYNLNDTLGIGGSGTNLESQSVASAVKASSVGHVYEKTGSSATKVKVQFASALKSGSGNTNAAVG